MTSLGFLLKFRHGRWRPGPAITSLKMKMIFRYAGWRGTWVLVACLTLFSNLAQAGIQVCALAARGLVSWWPAEGNADDVTFTNNGVLVGGAGFAGGVVGEAFDLNGRVTHTRTTIVLAPIKEETRIHAAPRQAPGRSP